MATLGILLLDGFELRAVLHRKRSGGSIGKVSFIGYPAHFPQISKFITLMATLGILFSDGFELRAVMYGKRDSGSIGEASFIHTLRNFHKYLIFLNFITPVATLGILFLDGFE